MRMDLTRDCQRVDLPSLKDKLMNLNEALSYEKSAKLAE